VAGEGVEIKKGGTQRRREEEGGKEGKRDKRRVSCACTKSVPVVHA